jgi:hypothetical protein
MPALVADLEADREAIIAATKPADSESELVAIEVEVAFRDAEEGEPPAQAEEEPEETAASVPVNDVEHSKAYARNAGGGLSGPAPAYKVADPAAVSTPDRGRFYETGYRLALRKMVDHVVETEGPVFSARLCGFQAA